MISDRDPLWKRGLALFAALSAVVTGMLTWAAFSGSAGLQSKRQPATLQVARAAERNARTHGSGQAQFDLLAKYLADDRRGRDAAEIFRQAADPASAERVTSQQHPLLGQPAPLFSLPDSQGQTWSLEEKLSQGPVVLVFYLNYGCHACVSSLFELNADVQLFQALGVEVAAISDDPAELTGRQFKRYGAFSFPVLSDVGHSVARTFGIFHPSSAESPERLLHATFVIGQDRQVKWVRTGDAPFTRSTALLCELAQLQRESLREGQAQVDSTVGEGR